MENQSCFLVYMIPGSIKFNIELFGEVAVNTIGDKVIDIIKDKISDKTKIDLFEEFVKLQTV